MNNATTNITTPAIDMIVQEVYETYVFTLCLWSAAALFLYAALLKLGQEVEFLWLKPFSWPALLYIFTRYGALFSIALRLGFFHVEESTCNLVLASFESILGILAFIGVQGLLAARAYSLIETNGILWKVFVFMLLSGMILQLAENIISDTCSVSINGIQNLLILLININIISTDILVFAVCMWKLWGTWRLSRQLKIRASRSLSHVLVKQGILRCCFVVVITVTVTIVDYRLSAGYISDSLSFYQNALSSIIVADFTLELRRQNSDSINASISLSSIRFSNILENVQRSILVEMTPPNLEVEGPSAGDGDNITIDIQSA